MTLRRTRVPAVVFFCLFAGRGTAAVPPEASPLREKVYHHPGLYPRELQEHPRSFDAALASRLEAELTSMGLGPDAGFYDSRAGRWGSLILSVPLVPGTGNDLAWDTPADESALRRRAWSALRAYMARVQDRLRVDPAELAEPSVGVFEGRALVSIHARRVSRGVPVRDSGLTATINHGNLVLFGLQNWGDLEASVVPAIGPAEARAAVAGHVRPFTVTGLRREPYLELVPLDAGDRYEYRLAWVVEAVVAGDPGGWEGLVDAHRGDLLSFRDTDLYAARKVVGGVYPASNDQRPPDGIEQAGWPMPFADVTWPTGSTFTDGGGNVATCAEGTLSTTLAGRFVRPSDGCGVRNETAATGDLDLGAGPTPGATDCVVPPGRSPGDTKASRTAFYELNRIKEQARAYLPGNPWLQGQLTANVNQALSCGGSWGGGTVNFGRDNGNICRNPGENPGVLDHEWGHGMDDNGVNGSISSPAEAIPDIHTFLRQGQSCIGRGFFKNNVCPGYGDACDGPVETGCTGVRDLDFMAHVCDRPHTVTWITQGFTAAQCNGTARPACPTGAATPCGREAHCEGTIVGETAFDLARRDLVAPPFNLDAHTAHELTTRLFFLGTQAVTSWYTCGTQGGCSATGGYLQVLAADDDNGDLGDGTPHMSAIRAAFERHEIHCAMPPVLDGGCAGGPTAAPAALGASPAPGGADLTWSAVPGAARYDVYRTEGLAGCDGGRIKVGQAAGTAFADRGLQAGRTYSYTVWPVGANGACFGRMSACASVVPAATPDPCVTLPSVSFTAAASTVAENAGPAGATVVLVTPDGQPITAPASVEFTTVNGTAMAGSDYMSSSGTLSFPAGLPSGSTAILPLTLLDDAIPEPAETFAVVLSNASGAILGATPTHTVTITDDDALAFIRGDFNQDGKTDILWRHDVSGENVLWYMNGAVLAGGEFTTPAALTDTRWKMVGTHDFNADLKNDILWRHDTAGGNVLWFMNGSVMTSGTFLTPAALVDINWKMAGTGLFDGDGRPDIAWHHQVSGEVVLWYMNGSVLTSGTFTSPSSFPNTNWRLVAVADFSSPLDNKPDFVWRHQGTGALLVWLMDNAVKTGETATTPAGLPDTRWKLVATGDYNLDIRNDFVWRHDESGENVIWFMNGATLVSGTFTNPAAFPDVRWKMVGPR
jgi:hypothetical protein